MGLLSSSKQRNLRATECMNCGRPLNRSRLVKSVIYECPGPCRRFFCEGDGCAHWEGHRLGFLRWGYWPSCPEDKIELIEGGRHNLTKHEDDEGFFPL